MLDAASTKQQMTRAFVRQALQLLPHDFDALDTCLLHHASLVNDAYDVWYRAFAQAVRVSNSILRHPRGFIPCCSEAKAA